jgi:hypothetical protein
MQIDFHHAATYVIARCGGFSHEDAALVAHCAQYVDDATNGGTIEFDVGAKYSRISSAHKTFDYRNFADLANHRVWIPFHFLPGNGGFPAGEDPPGGFINKLICRPAPSNPVAEDMLRHAMADRRRPYGLYRWGITMHVYADTWAHQGFAGVNHEINEVHELSMSDETLRSRIKRFVSECTSGAFPLGHGGALSAPDKPYLRWSYKNGYGEVIERDNPKDYLEAAQHMCKAMRRYRIGDPNAEVPGLEDNDAAAIAVLLAEEYEDGEGRHAIWAQRLAEGAFSFGAVELPSYIGKGINSWKHAALATDLAVDLPDTTFEYQPRFLVSDWKRFHDALQKHKFELVHEILPRYGICTA